MAITPLRENDTNPATLDDPYEALVQLSPDALYVIQEGRLVFINIAGTRQLRAASPEELLGLEIPDILHADYVEAALARIGKMSASGQPAWPMEQKYMRRDGSVIDVEVCSAPFLYKGKPAIQVIARDITDRKAAQEALRRSEEMHRTVAAEATRARASLLHEKKIFEMIALDQSLAYIFEEVCLGVEALLQGGARCSILLLDAEGTHVQVRAAPSFPDSFCAAINGVAIGSSAGSCGSAIHSNRQIIIGDIESDPLWDGYRAIAQLHGLRACWSTPIRTSTGIVLGAFGVYCPDVRNPTADDLAFIGDITNLIGIAIHKEKVERSLQESEDRYRTVVNSLTEGILVQSRAGVVLACNPSAERILKMGPDKLVGVRRGTYFKRVFTEDGASLSGKELPTQVVLRTGQPILNLIVGVEMMDGAVLWVSENVLPIQNPGETEPGAVLISFTDITAVKEAQQKLKFMATHDVLTGLPNRAFLTERLSHSLTPERPRAQRLAVLFLDLDRFKNVNDTIGHEAGDIMLRTVADRLGSCIRDTDTLARIGGDEFVVLTGDFDDPQFLTALAERILHVISEPFRLDDNEYYLGVSIGIGVYPEDGEDSPTLLRCADSAMYYAKERGRNNYQFFTEELNARTQRRYRLEKHLRHALDNSEFSLHYQAKLDLATGRIVGAEALLRWVSPDAGALSPVEFIPIAEETGLIVPIGLWVLEQACRQAAAWRKQLMPDLRIAVNLSPRQFQDDNLIKAVTKILLSTGLPPHALELEITESLLMGDTEILMPVFDALTGLGVQFSMDDFGTGYSSLSYLQRFPIRNLKIDRAFINGIPDDRDSVALTQAIIGMAKALEMTVTAEGVELQCQMDFLKQAGCHEMQGYYFSKPVPAAEFEQLIKGPTL